MKLVEFLNEGKESMGKRISCLSPSSSSLIGVDFFVGIKIYTTVLRSNSSNYILTLDVLRPVHLIKIVLTCLPILNLGSLHGVRIEGLKLYFIFFVYFPTFLQDLVQMAILG